MTKTNTKYKGKKLGKDLDEAFHISIIISYDYGWRYNKIIINNCIINDFDRFIRLFYERKPLVFNWERRDDSILLLKIENLITTVQYAEDLAAVSLSILEDRKIQKKLTSYRVKEIIDFYDSILKGNFTQIDVFKIMGYPMVKEKKPDLEKKLLLSTEKTFEDFKRIASFFNENHTIYNSIKHGFRCIVVGPGKREGKNGKMKTEGKKSVMIFDQSILKNIITTFYDDEVDNNLTNDISFIIYKLFLTIMPNQKYRFCEIGKFGDYRVKPVIY